MVVTDYNEQFLDKRGTDHLIEELKAYIDGISTGSVDLSDYVTKSELQAKLDALDINIDLSSYATKEELNTAINSIDLSAYAKTSDIPIVPTKVSELENDSGYLTEHQDLSAYALKTEIPSLDGYATTEYVDNAIANVPTGGTTDLSNYYTKDETYSKTEVDTLVANSGGSSSGGSSGSASGITYAYDTEIATGETWIDGKPIYMKVFHIDALTAQPSNDYDRKICCRQDKFADEIISVIPRWKRIDTTETYTGNVFPLVNGAKSASSASVAVSNVNTALLQRLLWCCSCNNTDFYLVVFRGKIMYQCICDVFVKYTKLS